MSNVQIANTDTQLASTLLSMNTVQKIAHTQLNNAQILTAPTTIHFEMVSAVGGKALIPFMAVFVSKFSTGAYTNLGVDGYWGIETNNGSGFGLEYVEDIVADSVTEFTNMMSNTNRIAILSILNSAAASGANYPPSQLISDYQGNIVLTCNGSAGDFTGGDSANTLDVYVHYFQLSV